MTHRQVLAGCSRFGKHSRRCPVAVHRYLTQRFLNEITGRGDLDELQLYWAGLGDAQSRSETTGPPAPSAVNSSVER
jgi:hypothetical protein